MNGTGRGISFKRNYDFKTKRTRKTEASFKNGMRNILRNIWSSARKRWKRPLSQKLDLEQEGCQYIVVCLNI